MNGQSNLWKRIRVHCNSIEAAERVVDILNEGRITTIEELSNARIGDINNLFGERLISRKVALDALNSFIDGDDSWLYLNFDAVPFEKLRGQIIRMEEIV